MIVYLKVRWVPRRGNITPRQGLGQGIIMLLVLVSITVVKVLYKLRLC